MDYCEIGRLFSLSEIARSNSGQVFNVPRGSRDSETCGIARATLKQQFGDGPASVDQIRPRSRLFLQLHFSVFGEDEGAFSVQTQEITGRIGHRHERVLARVVIVVGRSPSRVEPLTNYYN